MIVGYDKQEIELIIKDLRFTVEASKRIAESYKASLQKYPKQTQWLGVIGKAKGRGELAQEIINKLNELIQD